MIVGEKAGTDMQQRLGPVASPGASLATWRAGSWPRHLLLVIVGTLFLAACAWIEVPMVPVPMTMQTFGMVMIGAVYGWRLGGATVAVYLTEGAIGLPVFAGGAAGIHHFVGPTAGYLVAFVLAAMLVGASAERGLLRHPLSAFTVMLAGHLLILALGVAWLAYAVGLGLSQAVAVGATPFLIGMVLKSALAVACWRVLERRSRAA